MGVLLATLKESWSNEAESGCDVERLVDDDGYLTFIADTSFPNEQHYEEIYDDEEKALDWVHDAQIRATASFSADFIATDALFGRFPQLIDELGADLAFMSYKNEEGQDITETLRKRNGELELMTFYFTEFDTKIRDISEQDAKDWVKVGMQRENATFKLTAAGAVVYPDIAKELDKSGKDVKAKHDVSIDR